MSKSRESAIYLNFFRQQIWLMAIPSFALALGGYLYQQSLPARYRLTALLEMNYRLSELPQKTLLTDEAITALRTDVLAAGQNLGQNDIRLYKVGPVAVNVEIEGLNQDEVKTDLVKLETQAQNKYDFQERAVSALAVKKQPPFFLAGLGLTVGFFLGLLLSLVKVYLRDY